MSLLLRAAAAAARQGIGRSTSAATVHHGRRTMASFSSYVGTETMEGAWMIRMALWSGLGVMVNRGLKTNMREIAKEVHEEEIRSIRKDMKTLQASNEELLALLNRRGTKDH